jgi:hypothetical protein
MWTSDKVGVWVILSLLLLWCFGGCHRQSPIQATMSRMWPDHMGSETAHDFWEETEVEPQRKLVSCKSSHDTVTVSLAAVTKHQRLVTYTTELYCLTIWSFRVKVQGITGVLNSSVALSLVYTWSFSPFDFAQSSLSA